MAKLELGLTPTSVVLRVKLLDSSVTTGAGLTGLAHDSAGLIIGTIAIDEATATAYTQAGATIETITTLGTYAAPTATKCRFKEVDATNHPGLYEIHIADARFATVDSLVVSLSGAADLAEADFEISCKDLAMNTTGLAPANEYDTQLDATVSSRAATGEAATAVGTLNDITVADIIAGIADGSYDLQEMVRIMFGAFSGKSSGGGTPTLTYRDSADAKNRIVATVDEKGNRTAMALDGS